MEQSKSGLVGLTPQEEAHLMEHGFEYTPLPIPRDKYLKATTMTIGGAQIPVCQDIQKNKAEFSLELAINVISLGNSFICLIDARIPFIP